MSEIRVAPRILNSKDKAIYPLPQGMDGIISVSVGGVGAIEAVGAVGATGIGAIGA